MALVKSEIYPELRVADLGVKFRDGEAEVSDEAALARLRGLAVMGVVVPDVEEPVKRKPGRPRKSDSAD